MDSRNYKKVGEYKKWDALSTELDPGDLIEMDRGAFQHWGVAMENIDGKMIIIEVTGDFLTGLGAIVGKRGKKAVADIRVDELSTAVGTDNCRVNNSIDNQIEPFATGAQIVRRGLSKLGEHDYSVWESNCEHWGSWCRNGNMISAQADEKQKELEEMKSKPKHDLEKLKGKVEDALSHIKGPPTPEKIKVPDEVLNRLPFLKKFQGEKVQ